MYPNENAENEKKPRLILPPEVEMKMKGDEGKQDPGAEPSTTEGAEPTLEKRLEEMEIQHEELKNEHLRLMAEFSNFQKRNKKSADERVRYALQSFIEQMLTHVDSFEKAIETGRQATSAEAVVKGFEMIHQGVMSLLLSNDVAPVVAQQGDKANPEEHEVMMVVPDETRQAGEIVQVLQRGYRLRDRVIRPARVAVASGPQQPETEENKNPDHPHDSEPQNDE